MSNTNVTKSEVTTAVENIKAAKTAEEAIKASVALANLTMKVIGQNMKLDAKVSELTEAVEGLRSHLKMVDQTMASTTRVASEARGEQQRRTIAQEKAIEARKAGKIPARETAKHIKKITEHLGYDLIEAVERDEKNRLILGVWQWALSTGKVASCRRKVQQQGEEFVTTLNSYWPKNKEGQKLHVSRELVLKMVAQTITKLKLPVLDAVAGTPTVEEGTPALPTGEGTPTLPLEETTAPGDPGAIEGHSAAEQDSATTDEGTVIRENGQFASQALSDLMSEIEEPTEIDE